VGAVVKIATLLNGDELHEHMARFNIAVLELERPRGFVVALTYQPVEDYEIAAAIADELAEMMQRSGANVHTGPGHKSNEGAGHG
jgi:hypothetical protein